MKRQGLKDKTESLAKEFGLQKVQEDIPTRKDPNVTTTWESEPWEYGGYEPPAIVKVTLQLTDQLQAAFHGFLVCSFRQELDQFGVVVQPEGTVWHFRSNRDESLSQFGDDFVEKSKNFVDKQDLWVVVSDNVMRHEIYSPDNPHTVDLDNIWPEIEQSIRDIIEIAYKTKS